MTYKRQIDIHKIMSKKTAKSYLTKLSKLLDSESAKSAIAVLRDEAEKLSEPKVRDTNSGQGFEIPQEIKGKAQALAIFSDGACRGNPGPGSYAYMIQDPSGAVLDSGAEAFANTTNNRMEMLGAITGLKNIEASPLHQVHVYTDSKYIVDGMNSWIIGWKKRGWKKADKKAPENVDLWQELDQLASEYHTHFHWVKGHAGHPQNEFVDQLANEALDENGY